MVHLNSRSYFAVISTFLIIDSIQSRPIGSTLLLTNRDASVTSSTTIQDENNLQTRSQLPSHSIPLKVREEETPKDPKEFGRLSSNRGVTAHAFTENELSSLRNPIRKRTGAKKRSVSVIAVGGNLADDESEDGMISDSKLVEIADPMYPLRVRDAEASFKQKILQERYYQNELMGKRTVRKYKREKVKRGTDSGPEHWTTDEDNGKGTHWVGNQGQPNGVNSHYQGPQNSVKPVPTQNVGNTPQPNGGNSYQQSQPNSFQLHGQGGSVKMNKRAPDGEPEHWTTDEDNGKGTHWAGPMQGRPFRRRSPYDQPHNTNQVHNIDQSHNKNQAHNTNQYHNQGKGSGAGYGTGSGEVTGGGGTGSGYGGGSGGGYGQGGGNVGTGAGYGANQAQNAQTQQTGATGAGYANTNNVAQPDSTSTQGGQGQDAAEKRSLVKRKEYEVKRRSLKNKIMRRDQPHNLNQLHNTNQYHNIDQEHNTNQVHNQGKPNETSSGEGGKTGYDDKPKAGSGEASGVHAGQVDRKESDSATKSLNAEDGNAPKIGGGDQAVGKSEVDLKSQDTTKAGPTGATETTKNLNADAGNANKADPAGAVDTSKTETAASAGERRSILKKRNNESFITKTKSWLTRRNVDENGYVNPVLTRYYNGSEQVQKRFSSSSSSAQKKDLIERQDIDSEHSYLTAGEDTDGESSSDIDKEVETQKPEHVQGLEDVHDECMESESKGILPSGTCEAQRMSSALAGSVRKREEIKPPTNSTITTFSEPAPPPTEVRPPSQTEMALEALTKLSDLQAKRNDIQEQEKLIEKQIHDLFKEYPVLSATLAL